MRSGNLAKRYAKALFGLAVDSGRQEVILNELRSLAQAFATAPEVLKFFDSPVTGAVEKKQTLQKALEGKGVTAEVMQFMSLLADKGRLPLFNEIVDAFQTELDLLNNVCRGVVRSTTQLSPNDRSRVESTVEKVLKKKVIMTYKIDPSVIGGLVAEVGSYRFDDSLSSHLKRMTDDLKRRTV